MGTLCHEIGTCNSKCFRSHCTYYSKCCNEIHKVVILQTPDPFSLHARFVACLLLLRWATTRCAGESGVQLSIDVGMEAYGFSSTASNQFFFKSRMSKAGNPVIANIEWYNWHRQTKVTYYFIFFQLLFKFELSVRTVCDSFFNVRPVPLLFNYFSLSLILRFTKSS